MKSSTIILRASAGGTAFGTAIAIAMIRNALAGGAGSLSSAWVIALPGMVIGFVLGAAFGCIVALRRLPRPDRKFPRLRERGFDPIVPGKERIL